VNIVVCLSGQVAVGTLLPNERRALALARALSGGHLLTAVLAGSRQEGDALAVALAMGADRAIRIAGDGFVSTDFHTLGQVLARAVRPLGAQLVLAGARSDNERLGALSASVARHIGVPHLAGIESLDPLGEAERPAGSRATLAVTVRGGGRRRRLAIEPPFVMSVAGGGDEPPVALDDAARAALVARIEVSALADPEATVLRRRTEILGVSEAVVRATTEVASAAELLAKLGAA